MAPKAKPAGSLMGESTVVGVTTVVERLWISVQAYEKLFGEKPKPDRQTLKVPNPYGGDSQKGIIVDRETAEKVGLHHFTVMKQYKQVGHE